MVNGHRVVVNLNCELYKNHTVPDCMEHTNSAWIRTDRILVPHEPDQVMEDPEIVRGVVARCLASRKTSPGDPRLAGLVIAKATNDLFLLARC